jgi:hypothetical protein
MPHLAVLVRFGRTHLLWISFIAGLVLRGLMLSYMGGSDMDKYYTWGNGVLKDGLADSFHGVYFPIQYHIFSFCSYLTQTTSIPFYVVFKFADLLFEITNFFLILLLLKRFKANVLYSLIYWLHPWFLSLFSLGYIDSEYIFFVLLTILLLGGEDSLRSNVLAGATLGIAFLMKPQAQVLIVAAFLYAILRLIRFRSINAMALLVFPTLLFMVYSLFFYIFGTQKPITHLAFHYLNITNDYPRLSAYQINIWYIVACLIKPTGVHILKMRDDIILFAPFTIKHLAGFLTISILFFFIWTRTKLKNTTAQENILFIFAFSSTLLPFAMTSAHENHFFLGSLLGVILLARSNKRIFAVAFHILLLLHFLNLYGIYGNHPVFIADILKETYSIKLAFVYSVIATVCFLCILTSLFREKDFTELSPELLVNDGSFRTGNARTNEKAI